MGDDRSLDYVKIEGPGVDALNNRKEQGSPVDLEAAINATRLRLGPSDDDVRWLERFMRRRWDVDARSDFVQQDRQGTERALRARRFANTIIATLDPFLASDRTIHKIIWNRLVETAFMANAEIVQVPPEWDHLRKMQIEREMLNKQFHVTPSHLTMEFDSDRRVQGDPKPKPNT